MATIGGQFRKAGKALGLDLAALFDDEDDNKLAESNVFAPELTVSSTSRGRGYGMTMEDVQRDPKTTELKLTTAKGGGIVNNFNPKNENSVSVTTGGGGGGGGGFTPAPSKPNIDISFGLRADKFGHDDYFRNLERGVSAEDLKQFVMQNPGLLTSGNVAGAGGLYDEIMSGNVRTNWNDKTQSQKQEAASKIAQAYQQSTGYTAPAPGPVTSAGNVSTGSGASAQAFGHADVAAARARGASTAEIMSFVNANQGLLKGTNAPGQGGLYDQLLRGQI